MKLDKLFLLAFPFFILACNSAAPEQNKAEDKASEAHPTTAVKTVHYEQEQHLANVQQLTFGGDNAEAYFSFDGKYLSFQATNPEWGAECDQIFFMPITGNDGGQPKMVSTGKGRTTCAYYMPGDQSIIYASTHLADEACPEAPRSLNGKYVWAVFPSFDIFVTDLEGNIQKQLTDSPGYDAEPTLSPDGSKIVFTSTRSGDLELYTMNTDGSDVRQITSELGYDGGAFFSPDGTRLVFRASRPTTEEEVKTYKELLAKNLVQPTAMEIFTCKVDGSDLQQVTDLGGANWAPYYHPSGKKILFSSNHHSKSGRQFNIFSIGIDGSDLQQITFDEAFDAFPMFSPDGKKLAFSSNRNNKGRDTNVFIADWVE